MYKNTARNGRPTSQTPGQVRALLESNGIRASKALGQNFLIDMDIPQKMARLAGIGPDSGVLEIGPGLGALTRFLADKAGHVAAVELDARLVLILHELFSGVPTVDIIQGDILKMDIAGLVKDKLPGLAWSVCANLPYSITTPVLAAIIDSGVFESVTVMVQREVAGRMTAEPGTPGYGALTVFIKYHTVPEILFDAPPECFYPKPEVCSTVVRMNTLGKRLPGPEDEAFFFRVVKAAFSQRRKTLVNALCASFGCELGKGQIIEIVRKRTFDDKIRGEMLGVDEFIGLSGDLKPVIEKERK